MSNDLNIWISCLFIYTACSYAFSERYAPFFPFISLSVSLLGGHFKGEVSKNWGHQTGNTHWSALWKLPWSVWNQPVLSDSPSFSHISNLTTCFLLLQKRWPPICATWGGWTSLRSLIMTTWESSSLIFSTGMAMSLTMNTTGSANHLWVPLKDAPAPCICNGKICSP